jgi:hypothetical protein
MTRRYFRRWFFWHGRTLARMGDSYLLDVDLDRVPRVARVPRFIYRELFRQIRRWLRALTGGDTMESLVQELLTIQYVGFFVECWRPYRPRHQAPAERSGSGPAKAEMVVG